MKVCRCFYLGRRVRGDKGGAGEKGWRREGKRREGGGGLREKGEREGEG
jgi:hypothetical protein